MAKEIKKVKATEKVVLDDFDNLENLENPVDTNLDQEIQDVQEYEEIQDTKEKKEEQTESDILKEEEEAKIDIQNMIKEENEKNMANKKKPQFKFSEATLDREKIISSESFLQRFKEYIENNEYKKLCKKYADKCNVPAKKVESKFLGKMLGAIGDALGFVIDCIEATADLIIKILTYVLLKGISLICKVARAISSIISFNHTLKTC